MLIMLKKWTNNNNFDHNDCTYDPDLQLMKNDTYNANNNTSYIDNTDNEKMK